MPEKKTLPLATLTQDQRTKLGMTLIGHAHDLRVDEEQITEEEGFDLVTALDTLGEELRSPARPRKLYLSFDDEERAQAGVRRIVYREPYRPDAKVTEMARGLSIALEHLP